MKLWLPLCILFLFPTVGAIFAVEEDVTISYQETIYHMGYTKSDVSSLTFEDTSDNAPIINGFTLDLSSTNTDRYEWVILNFSLPEKVQVYGNTSVDGTLRIAGIGGSYNVNGVFGTTDFTIQGPTSTFVVPAGEQTITITPLGSLQSGPRIAVSAEYSALNQSITTAITVSSADGTASTGQAGLLTVKLFNPSAGMLYDTPAVVETSVPGVYKAVTNISSPEEYGTWLVTAQYYALSAAQIVKVEPAPLTEDGNLEITSTTFDTWLPIVVWGIVLFALLWSEAWFPAFFAGLNLGSTILPEGTPGKYGHEAGVMFLLIGLFLHVLFWNALERKWFRRDNKD